jgi:hypothetical protein
MQRTGAVILRSIELRHVGVFLSLVSLSLVFLIGTAHAGTIEKVRWRGHNVLKLTGSIDDELVTEFMSARDHAEVWPHGAQVLLLDSPGGGVMAALAIVNLMDQGTWQTVIPNGAECASACASILFVSGAYRTVEPFGKLGQHSCSKGGLPDDKCNDLMSENARAHGVSYGSIKAFAGYASPGEMIWFSREDADGWGLTRYPGEKESGFQKSEPRVLNMLTGVKPEPQTAWRLDFHNDGYKAFSRPSADDEREMEIGLFCNEAIPGALIATMDITGPVEVVKENVTGAWLGADGVKFIEAMPLIMPADPMVTRVFLYIPPEALIHFLKKTREFVFHVDFKKPFTAMRATTQLAGSRKNLIFAANHCGTKAFGLDGQPIE